jgi:hypothetical protein
MPNGIRFKGVFGRCFSIDSLMGLYTVDYNVFLPKNRNQYVPPKRRYKLIRHGVKTQNTIIWDERWEKKTNNFSINVKIRFSSIFVTTANIPYYSSDSDRNIHTFRKVGASTPNLRK